MAALTGLRCGRSATWSAPTTRCGSPISTPSTRGLLGGTVAALDGARQAAQRAGARRFEMLDVAVASHGPLQRDTAHVVAQYLSTVPHREQRAAYLTNVGARRSRNDPAAVLDDLATAVAHPVRWFDIMRLLPELGVVATVEMPPGHVLTRLARRDHADTARIQCERRWTRLDRRAAGWLWSMRSHSPIIVPRISSARPRPARWLSPGRWVNLRVGQPGHHVLSVFERDDVVAVAVPPPDRHLDLVEPEAPVAGEHHDVGERRGELLAAAVEQVVEEHRPELRADQQLTVGLRRDQRRMRTARARRPGG